MEQLPNILALRYASSEMAEIWSARNRVISERKLWVAILKAQRELGLDISKETISAYEKVVEDVDLNSIQERENVLQHDLKARIEEFSALAGEDQIHQGLTSRDITENVEQIFIQKSSRLILDKALKCLEQLTDSAEKYKDTPLVARTHNVPAQITTLGRRFSMLGEELMAAAGDFSRFLEEYKLRGIKGAVGTQDDLLNLFDGNPKKVKELEKITAKYLNSQNQNQSEVLEFTGQIYPRSLDLKFSHHLVQMASSPANFAVDFRLMAGQGLVNEGHGDGSVGSSAMPHKTNPSMCERISGLNVLVKGYMGMFMELTGAQWNEGDVSCSVVRRAALPDICFVAEAIFNTWSAVLSGMEINTQAMEAEVNS